MATDKDVHICSEKQYANVPCKESKAVFIAPEFPKAGAHTAQGGSPHWPGEAKSVLPQAPSWGRVGSTPAAMQLVQLLTFSKTFLRGVGFFRLFF